MADVGRELLILGILRRAPLSAYDVELAVRAHAPLFRLLKRGNVYYTLDRLAEQKLLTRRNVPAQRGRLATKAVYRVAVVQAAGERRFRAIVMTTAAMIAGMTPLALGQTAGAEYRKALGTVVIGGLSSSLLLTLFVVPLAYVAYRSRDSSPPGAERRMAENFFEKAGAFAGDAAIDTAADTEINRVIDGVAGHIPGGGMIDGMAKTGIDLAVNNEINSKLGGIFGHHDAAAPADAAAPDESAVNDHQADDQS